MILYWFLLGTLCVWRLTWLVANEAGPFGVLERLRAAAAKAAWGMPFRCFYCLSLWVAAPVAIAIGATLADRALLWPSLSAAAILLERATGPNDVAAPALYSEDPEAQDAVLR